MQTIHCNNINKSTITMSVVVSMSRYFTHKKINT